MTSLFPQSPQLEGLETHVDLLMLLDDYSIILKLLVLMEVNLLIISDKASMMASINGMFTSKVSIYD